MNPRVLALLLAAVLGGCAKKEPSESKTTPSAALSRGKDPIADELPEIARKKGKALVFFSGSGTFLCDANRKMLQDYAKAHPEWRIVEVPVARFGERAAQWGVDAVPTTFVLVGRTVAKKKVGLLLSFEEIDRMVSQKP